MFFLLFFTTARKLTIRKEQLRRWREFLISSHGRWCDDDKGRDIISGSLLLWSRLESITMFCDLLQFKRVLPHLLPPSLLFAPFNVLSVFSKSFYFKRSIQRRRHVIGNESNCELFKAVEEKVASNLLVSFISSTEAALPSSLRKRASFQYSLITMMCLLNSGKNIFHTQDSLLWWFSLHDWEVFALPVISLNRFFKGLFLRRSFAIIIVAVKRDLCSKEFEWKEKLLFSKKKKSLLTLYSCSKFLTWLWKDMNSS